MFAGRYLWWMLMSVAGFLFFAVYFDYVTWLLVQVSACQSIAGACGRIHQVMGGQVKPAGFVIAGSVVVLCTAARVFHLRLWPLWSIAFIVWFLASAPFVLIFRKVWSGHLTFGLVGETMPPAFAFLVAMSVYLLFPLEEWPRFAQWRARVQVVAGTAALYGVLYTLATLEGLPMAVETWTGMFGAAAALGALQGPLLDALMLGTGPGWAGFAAAGLFAACVLAQLLPAALPDRPAVLEGRG